MWKIKKTILIITLIVAERSVAQNVGIGTAAPLSKLHIDSGSLLITGNTGNVPFNGAGTRFMWIPAKAAARFGKLDEAAANNWHADSVGYFSLAAGKNAKAKGDSASIALGWNVSAEGRYGSIALGDFASATGNSGAAAIGGYVLAAGQSSIAIGQSARATGGFSHSIGNSSQASGYAAHTYGNFDSATANYSMAIGNSSFARGEYSVAAGFGSQSNAFLAWSAGNFCIANGMNSFAIGNSNTAYGTASFAAGTVTTSRGDNSFAAGYFIKQKSYGGFAAGMFNDTLDNGFAGGSAPDNRIFQIGNGTADNARSNAMTVLQNGNTGLGILNPLTKLDIAGNIAINNKVLLLRGGSDLNHGLRYDTLTDGPYLYGFMGGVLGTTGEPHSLAWDFAGNVTIRNQLNVGTKIIVDTANDNNGNLANALVFGASSGEGIASKRTAGGNQYGIDFYTASINRLSISNGGNIGIGTTNPAVPLQFANAAGNKIALFQSGANYYGLGTQASLLQVYTPTAADDIAFGYGNSTSFTENIRMGGSGSLAVKTNLTVQNGKGIIRTADGTQKKQLSAVVTINTSFLAGETKTFAVTWPESFTAAPDAYVGNVTGGAGGWAEVVMTISGAGTGGATLYVYNPKTTSVSPNFTVKVIAIGAQ